MSAVTADCPSTAIDCVKAVAMSVLLASTCEEDITVPLTKLGYGFEYVPEPFLAIYRTPNFFCIFSVKMFVPRDGTNPCSALSIF